VGSAPDKEEEQTDEQEDPAAAWRRAEGASCAGSVAQRGDDRRAGGEVSTSPNQIYAWKKQLLDGTAPVFSNGAGKEASREAKVNELYAKIGQLTVERDFYHGGPGDEPARADGDVSWTPKPRQLAKVEPCP
jgi:hypothetical protein